MSSRFIHMASLLQAYQIQTKTMTEGLIKVVANKDKKVYSKAE